MAMATSESLQTNGACCMHAKRCNDERLVSRSMKTRHDSCGTSTGKRCGPSQASPSRL